ncbi:MAG: hypothetical protein MJ227_02090 [Bacilli bacterium]|nr:hypothetical protein [Bacilli bacterium]
MKIRRLFIGITAALFASAGLAFATTAGSQTKVDAVEDTKTVYLELNNFQGWENDGAKFALWLHQTSTWSADMTKLSNYDHIYSVEIPTKITSCNFVRFDPKNPTRDFSVKWNQSGDVNVNDYNCCAITGWDGSQDQKNIKIVEDGYYLVGTMNEWTADSSSKMSKNADKDEYTISQEFKTDDEFKIVKYSRFTGTWYGWDKLEDADGSARKAKQIVPADDKDPECNMKVSLAGTYSPYFKVGESKIWISAIEVTHTYTLTVNSENPVTLVKNPDNENEYMTETALSLKKGDVLCAYLDGSVFEANAKEIGNNNCWNNEGVTTVCLNREGKVYVDVSGKTIFCSGFNPNAKYMLVNDLVVDLAHNENPVDPTFDEFYTTGYTFAKNDVVKFVDTNTEYGGKHVVDFSILKINESSVEGFTVTGDETKLLVCTAENGITTSVYAKFKTDNDEVYFGDVTEDLAAAIKYAQAFNSAMSAICKNDNTTNLESLKGEWSNQSDLFSKLIPTSKTILKEVTSSSESSDLAKFADKYDYIYGKYGGDVGANFADRAVPNFSNMRSLLSSYNQNAGLIVVIALVCAIPLLVGTAFIIKKKKHN